MADKKTQLAVIGGGPGGYAAAFLAADLGLEVTLIDPEINPGGVCLYRGCIPSKTLLHAARVIDEAREARAWGLNFSGLKIEPTSLAKWKNEVVARLTGGLGQLVKQRKINYLQATAAFEDNRTLAVKALDGGQSRLTFENAIIATGSDAARIPQFDLDSDRLLDATAALDLKEIPKKLLVIGGGYIGLELGTVYAALGSKVTVVEMTDGLLPGADRDLVRILQNRLADRLASILLQTTVKSLKVQKNGIRATLAGPEADQKGRLFDKVLLAVGRRPNSVGLGLANTAIEVDSRGFIKVDDQRRAAEKHIFAIGDVAGEPMLAHKASHEGRVAAEVIAGRQVAFEPAAIPAVVFTDPEIAWVGLTEQEAADRSIAHKVVKFPWAASGRAATLGRDDGLTKLVIDPRSERIIGMGIAGPGAGEMISEGVLAIEMGANATDVGLTIHPHPTLTETIMEAADLFHGSATHFYQSKRKSR
ncbi:dihydrolipoamide dehydrogenase [Alkalispirochaeta odontotermitis]|nr:dihydrolipoamide dehydrogenase [Alkalispirochaeta odontotermitis]CAB1075597.1 Dihydrolipoamide dehydrogenase of pyruvate dehydrogenase complex (EC [Olavius algarvensis Delta 1 endosymbiont]